MARRATQAAPSVAGQLVGRTDELAILSAPSSTARRSSSSTASPESESRRSSPRSRSRPGHETRTSFTSIAAPSNRPNAGSFTSSAQPSSGSIATAANAAYRLGSIGSRVVLTLDTYEVFRLLDMASPGSSFPGSHQT